MKIPIAVLSSRSTRRLLLGTLLSLYLLPSTHAFGATADLKNLSINGGLEDGKARLIIEAVLNNLPSDKEKLIYAVALQQLIRPGSDKLTNVITATLDILQGNPKELPLAIAGDGEIHQVSGAPLQDWSIRQ